jgi:hypothetical protein
MPRGEQLGRRGAFLPDDRTAALMISRKRGFGAWSNSLNTAQVTSL